MLGHVAGIGLEIEGPWTERVAVKGFVGDFHTEYMPHPPADIPLYMRECVSVPLRNEAQVNSFFDQVGPHFYEEGIMDGMGFHIHFSFADQKHYDLVLSPKFVQELTERLFTDFRDDERLQRRPDYRSEYGSNFYKMDYPEDYWMRNPPRDPRDGRQADGRKNRYYMVNFWRAFEAHQTFEIRILPANTVEKMREYVAWTINFINEYIDTHLPEYGVKIVKNVALPKGTKQINMTKDMLDEIEFIQTTKEPTHRILQGDN